MELPSHEEEIPIPLNTRSTSAYNISGSHGHEGHMIQHHHRQHQHHDLAPPPPSQVPFNNNGPNSSSIDQNPNQNQTPQMSHVPFNSSSSNNKKDVVVRYKECLKNHAASMGGNAIDGCGEFIPNGEEGSIDALTCSACNCHRNFHRKEIEGREPTSYIDNYYRVRSRKIINTNNLYLPAPVHGHHHQPQAIIGYPTTAIPHSSRGLVSTYNDIGSVLPTESDEQDQDNVIGGGIEMARPQNSSHGVMIKKRFRTKFTQEQKEKMLQFAEKVGWKLQKQEESVVQQFCQEIGVKRRVLKVWMHNNKHNLAKKNELCVTT